MEASDYEGNRARFTGFAELYDRHRFRPPAAIAALLLRYASVERADLVVDLGCATGPSTRYWAPHANRVVGVDPVEDMLATARAVTSDPNVEYVLGYGHATGLPDACADMITCSQSFHWMEPGPTLAEVARIARPGGVFAAYDYSAGSATGIVAVDRAAEAATERICSLESKHGLKRETRFFGKDGHTQALRASGRFAFVTELTLHGEESATAQRLVGGFETFGALQSLRKLGLSDCELGLADLRAVAEAHLGERAVPIHVSYRMCLGVLAEAGPGAVPDAAASSA